ncbi:hypothetical protein UPYG_G00056410 [Umbra pygmaea]|uniref:C2H2-type domain-containing protein n=1 Tax=Umbra pygmaea TaxID=75934 RepID=A0ABD0X8B5_UMBPY
MFSVVGWEMHSCHHEMRSHSQGGCSDAKQGPHAAYNSYKDFFMSDTTALFLSAAMEQFALQDVTEIPDMFVPEDLAAGSPEMKRAWLHNKTSEVVDKCIMLGDVPDAVSGIHEVLVTSSQRKQFPCRVEGCGQLYTYLKARDNHERIKHNIDSSSPTLPEEKTPLKRDHKKRTHLGTAQLWVLYPRHAGCS